MSLFGDKKDESKAASTIMNEDKKGDSKLMGFGNSKPTVGLFGAGSAPIFGAPKESEEKNKVDAPLTGGLFGFKPADDKSKSTGGGLFGFKSDSSKT